VRPIGVLEKISNKGIISHYVRVARYVAPGLPDGLF
jgi:hypothetical protein